MQVPEACTLPSLRGLAMAAVLLLTGGDGCIAQLVEQLTLNQRAVGSSPTAPTNQIKLLPGDFVTGAKVWVTQAVRRIEFGS
jgi:hypothetical protein